MLTEVFLPQQSHYNGNIEASLYNNPLPFPLCALLFGILAVLIFEVIDNVFAGTLCSCIVVVSKTGVLL